MPVKLKPVSYNPETGIIIGSSGKEITAISSGGYLRVMYEGRVRQAHHVAWHMTHGYFPTTLDHIDLNKLNNRISNLREATTTENLQNRPKFSNNKSGHKGVYKAKDTKVYRVQVTVNKRVMTWNGIEDFELACLIADEAREKFHGMFAHH